MATSTFTGRADTQKLDFCDKLVRRERGISFAQYCANDLVDQIYTSGKLPASEASEERLDDWVTLHACIEALGKVETPLERMNYAQVKEEIAARYA